MMHFLDNKNMSKLLFTVMTMAEMGITRTRMKKQELKGLVTLFVCTKPNTILVLKLLRICRSCFGIKTPKTARAICHTDLTPVNDGNFIHIGLELGIRRRILNPAIIGPSQSVNLHVFIDGKRHGKGKENSMWPILGRVANSNDQKPFVISCYFGTGKPPSLKEFVQPFIDEYNKLRENGVEIQGGKYNILLKCVICDAQARSFCKCIIAANGEFACERCECKGIFLQDFHSMCYPDFNAHLRTHHHRLILNAWLRGEVPNIFSNAKIKHSIKS